MRARVAYGGVVLAAVPVRRALVPILVFAVSATALLAEPAAAGGNWLDLRKDGGSGRAGAWGVVNVGEAVVAHTTVWVHGGELRRRLEDSTFYAWLAPPSDDLFEEPRLPDGSIRLAPFHLRWASERVVVVKARFLVPQVPSNDYELLVCDDPCTFPGFGESVMAWPTVVQTPTERRLLALTTQRRGEIRTLHRRLAAEVERAEALQRELDAAMLGHRTVTRTDTARIAALEAELAGLRQASVPEAPESASWPLVLGWAVAVAAVAFALGVLGARRRRSPGAIVVPDTVPADLERLERVR